MDIELNTKEKNIRGHIKLNSSKSESNRVLVINALSGNLCKITNLSNARDTETMQRLLSSQHADIWDVLDAGTTMRFLTALSAVSDRARTLTGTARMQQRPIKVLGDALQSLGAGVEYLKAEGYPPLRVTPISRQASTTITVPGDISSQYISALLMIAPGLPEGLTVIIEGTIYSRPYIEMTLSLMQHFGITYSWEGQVIRIANQPYQANEYMVESDWSGASYWYSIAALAEECDLYLEGLRKESNQGDAAIATIMENFGVRSEFDDKGVKLSKTDSLKQSLEIDFKNCPDLAQTVIACAAVKGIDLQMTGLESLKIKETDRIHALQQETAKFGGQLTESGDSWQFKSNPQLTTRRIVIETYEDHRMAMAFAPLSLTQKLLIKERDVVNKSYPDFWRDLEKVGIR